MNWDISIGNGRQLCGRVLKTLGQQLDRRALVLTGEQIESRGRLQTRYGLLKHQEQWGASLARMRRQLPPSGPAEEPTK